MSNQAQKNELTTGATATAASTYATSGKTGTERPRPA
jgi:cobalamin biosynthesis protein CbiD